MTASNGTKFGPYEILSQIGAGGMGEVYRARDTRLGREVAVKVLPSSFAENSERLARFEQEACAAGSLNHPNILAIYDIGKHDDAPYVVCELLEGKTLREKMDGSPLPQRKAIDYALQIAHGLAAAHEKGIVHRDLKPDNLFITKDGRVKILDFGLAKLIETSPLGQVATEVPTRKVKTDSGMVMGTVGYMSPEQVRGLLVDHRSDIFSFGAILYEMLAGKRAFRHESSVETLNAILKEDPPSLTESNQTVNPALERIVTHCLEKNPEERFHAASDLAFALEALSGTGSISSGQTVEMSSIGGRRISRRELTAWIVAGTALAAAAIALFLIWPRPINEQPAATARFSLEPPDGMFFAAASEISPDGRRIVVRIRDASGKSMLWIRPIDSVDWVPLPGTDDARQPFWSPDSRMIGFFTGGKLKRIDISGGPPQTICDSNPGFGGTWNPDGVIVFGKGRGQGIHSVPASGGVPTPVTTLDKDRKEFIHHWPRFLPDGRHFLFSANDVRGDNRGIYVGSIDSKESKLILPGIDSSSGYVPPGYVLFVGEGALMARPFDANKLEFTGEALLVVENVAFNSNNSRGHFSISDTGTLVYKTDFDESDNGQITWCDRTGKTTATIGVPGKYLAVSLSPDEKRLATVLPEGDGRSSWDIWVLDLPREAAATRLTFDPAGDIYPTWSPDGGQMVFASTREGVPNLFQKAASGAGDDELLLKTDRVALPNDWSRDGQYLLYQQIGENTGMDLWVMPLSGDRTPFVFLQTGFQEGLGRFSPDGRWVAYVSNESGRSEVYARGFPSAGGKWQVSTAGGTFPRWRADGKELFYVTDAGNLMAVDVKTTGEVIEIGVPKQLFGIGPIGGLVGVSYDVSNDGQRFLRIVREETPNRSPLIVVTNWTNAVRH